MIRLMKRTGETEMDLQKLEAEIARYPVCEYAFIRPETIPFLEEVRYICRTECPQYGKSWSCPPAVGTVTECRERCLAYAGGFLFTTIAEVNDTADMAEMLATRMEHEKITRQMRALFRTRCSEVLALSAESCALCETCTCPDAPCRHPEQMLPCIESHGILVTRLAEESGICFMNEGNVVTWFGLLLYR